MFRSFLWLSLLLTSLQLAGQEPGTPPCACCQPEHQAFDFWIGSWEVRDVSGKRLGTNRIEKQQGGCLLQEHWVGAGGQSTGSSFNYFNSKEGRWEQLWVDRSGTVLKLYGNGDGNRMVLTSEPFQREGQAPGQHRITWSLRPDGTVRQHWEVLAGGESVQTLFDGIYTRMPQGE